MKKVIFILFILVLIVCLVACESETTDTIKQKSTEDIRIWTDEETGVQYIVYCDTAGYCGMGGITPRLNADGTLYISTEKGGAE